MAKRISQTALLKEYFRQYPHQDIATAEVVDWVTAEYHERTGKIFRDPDRVIRRLHQQGFLQKIAKGLYRYDPDYAHEAQQEDFSQQQKESILRRDNYQCVLCGRGKAEGMELHVDHIRPKELGGKATLENGQTLCSQHNMLKKTMQQTETGKKMFIRLYELAKAEQDGELQAFCQEILRVYDEHGINGHIEWQAE